MVGHFNYIKDELPLSSVLRCYWTRTDIDKRESGVRCFIYRSWVDGEGWKGEMHLAVLFMVGPESGEGPRLGFSAAWEKGREVEWVYKE